MKTEHESESGGGVGSSVGLGRNPIFVEYYSHEGCNCYKLKMPWPRYAEENVVLCREDAGFARAREIAAEILHDYIGVVMKRPNVKDHATDGARDENQPEKSK